MGNRVSQENNSLFFVKLGESTLHPSLRKSLLPRKSPVNSISIIPKVFRPRTGIGRETQGRFSEVYVLQGRYTATVRFTSLVFVAFGVGRTTTVTPPPLPVIVSTSPLRTSYTPTPRTSLVGSVGPHHVTSPPTPGSDLTVTSYLVSYTPPSTHHRTPSTLGPHKLLDPPRVSPSTPHSSTPHSPTSHSSTPHQPPFQVLHHPPPRLPRPTHPGVPETDNVPTAENEFHPVLGTHPSSDEKEPDRVEKYLRRPTGHLFPNPSHTSRSFLRRVIEPELVPPRLLLHSPQSKTSTSSTPLTALQTEPLL